MGCLNIGPASTRMSVLPRASRAPSGAGVSAHITSAATISITPALFAMCNTRDVCDMRYKRIALSGPFWAPCPASCLVSFPAPCCGPFSPRRASSSAINQPPTHRPAADPCPHIRPEQSQSRQSFQQSGSKSGVPVISSATLSFSLAFSRARDVGCAAQLALVGKSLFGKPPYLDEPCA